MKNNGCLDWNDFIGEITVPPPVLPELEQELAIDRYRSMLLGNIVGIVSTASVSVLEKVDRLIVELMVEGCDQV